MRNITQNLFNRLHGQASEADLQGMTKLAEHLTAQLEKTSIREDEEFYIYAADEFAKDVEQEMWDAVMRVADFHNLALDAEKAEAIVEKFASKLIREVELTFGAETGVGAFEPTLPGEKKVRASLEVEDE